MDRVRQALQVDGLRFGGQGVRVAVIDTGVDQEHPDLRESVESCESLLALDATPEDRSGHGTHIAGIIAGSGTESDGRWSGIAPG